MVSENFDVEKDFDFEEDFDLVFKKRSEEFNKKNSNNQRNIVSNNNREEIPWYGLENGVESVIRILGKPIEARKDSFHGKFIYYSELLTDTKKRYSDILWHTQKDPHDNSIGIIDSEWVLHRLFDSVYKKYWDNTPFIDSKGTPRKGKYIYANEHTSVYKLLESNELELTTNTKIYPKKSKPSKRAILPVLVRNEGSSEIKILTTKYVSKNYTDSQGNNRVQVYCDFGIPVSEVQDRKYLYDLIMDEIYMKYKHWDLDIVIKKTKLTDIQIAYNIHPAYSDSVSALAKSYVTSFPEMKDVPEMVNNKQVMTKKPKPLALTPQEESLVKANIDQLFPETSYKKLFTYHKGLFKLTDSEIGTNFYQELVDLYIKECPQDAHLIPADKITLPVKEEEFIQLTNVVPLQTSTSLPVSNVTESSRRKTVEPVTSSSVESQCSKVFTHWNRCNQQEKNLMISTIESFADGIPQFRSEYTNKILSCNCERKYLKSDGSESEKRVCFHEDIHNCPMCEQTF